MFEIDSIATDWINERMLRIPQLAGYVNIDSFMGDIEGLIDHIDEHYPQASKEFQQLAPQLASSALYPHNNSDQQVCEFAGLDPDANLKWYLGTTNVTTLTLNQTTWHYS